VSGRFIPPPAERGAALLAVLVLVAVMGAMATAAFDKLRTATALSGNASALDQARAYAVGIESLLALRVDDMIGADAERTTLEGGWNGAVRTIPLPEGRGIAGASVRDGGNCFNLNGLVQGQPPAGLETRTIGLMQFGALLRLAGVAETEADGIAQAAADWADSDSVPNRAGAEDGDYAGRETPYRTPNTLYAEPSELRAVAGMTSELYERLRPLICALPTTEGLTINVNTLLSEQAPLLALLAPDAITAEAARAAIGQRPSGGWDSVGDFWKVPALRQAEGRVQTQPQLATRWFALRLRVEVDGIEVDETALVDARSGRARVVLRRWGSED
jgi:general secretion pathway protein K